MLERDPINWPVAVIAGAAELMAIGLFGLMVIFYCAVKGGAL